MASKLSDRFEERPDAEAIFALFVRNANAQAVAEETRRSRPPRPAPAFELPGDTDVNTTPRSVVFDSNLAHSRHPVPSGHVVLLTQRKKVAVDLDAEDTQETPALTEEAARQVVATFESGRASSADRLSKHDAAANDVRRGVRRDVPRVVQKKAARRNEAEAAKVVPDVASVAPPPPPVPEKSEDGHMPAGELERILTDMTVLRRYDRGGLVRQRLEELVARYPEDLLLLRRIAEFHLENDDPQGAIDMLFLLAGRLFERRNVLGMRQALEQVLVLDPKHKRAYKLLGLLEQRPDTGTG